MMPATVIDGFGDMQEILADKGKPIAEVQDEGVFIFVASWRRFAENVSGKVAYRPFRVLIIELIIQRLIAFRSELNRSPG
jgi:hypothetical protein